MNTRHILAGCLLTLCLAAAGNAQTFYSPIAGITASSFTSAFGPRNLGSLEYPSYTDDSHKYDYDFHGGMDIASPNQTKVHPVVSGTVTAVGTLGDQYDYIIVKSQWSDGSDFWVKYLHVRHSVSIGDNVAAGTTTLGTIVDYQNDGAAHDHLDIRYFPDKEEQSLDKNADNPGQILSAVQNNTFTSSAPSLLDSYGSTIPADGRCEIRTETDPETRYNNPANAEYFTIGVQIPSTALSTDYLHVELTGNSPSQGSYSTTQLLRNTLNSITLPEYEYPATVMYFTDGEVHEDWPDIWRVSCGDRSGIDDDDGHVSKTIGIYPKSLNFLPQQTHGILSVLHQSRHLENQ